jgi:hypothetical protein
MVVVCGTGADEGLLQATTTSIIRPKQDFIFIYFSKGSAIIIFSNLVYSYKIITWLFWGNYMYKEWAVVIKTGIILLLFYKALIFAAYKESICKIFLL